jgi:tetratricopeptide (TPR) repeat protein
MTQQNLKQLDENLVKAIFICFNLILFVTPFLFTWSNQELFEFIKMLFTYGGTIIITLLWLSRMIINNDLIFRKTKLDLPLIIFLLTQILATVFSIHPHTSIYGYYTRFHGGLLSIISYSLLYWAFVSNLAREHIKPLLVSTLGAGALISLYAIPEHFGHSPSCQLITGNFNVDCWIQDVQNRVFATFGQPNWLAAYLITLIPLNISFFFKLNQDSHTKKLSWLTLINSVLMTTALIFTKSRSGLIGFIASLVLMSFGWLLVAIKFKFWPFSKMIGSLKKLPQFLNKASPKFWTKLGLVLASLALPILIFGTTYTPSLQSVIKNLSSPPSTQKKANQKTQKETPVYGGTESGDIRKIVWQGALKVWQRYPVFGSGVATFAYSYYQDRPLAHNLVSEWDFLYNKAHNEFVNFLATTGTVGFVGYCLLLAGIYWVGLSQLINWSDRKLESQTDQPLLAIALLASITALSISNFFGFSTVVVTILMFLLPAIFIVATDQGEFWGAIKTPNKFTLIQVISLILASLIGLHLLLNVYRFWKADKLLTEGQSLISLREYQDGIAKLQTAVQLVPNQALFYDELASSYADISKQFVRIDQATAATEFAQLAVEASDKSLRLNPRHLNYYKSRADIYTDLSAIDPKYLNQAAETLQSARELAPTNPKLVYQLGLVKLAQGKKEEAIQHLEKAIEMKTDYYKARYELAEVYRSEQMFQQAKKHYQYILDQIPTDKNVKSKLESIEASISAQQPN